MKTLKKYEDLIKKCGFITFTVLLSGLCGLRILAQQPGTITLNLEETVRLAGDSSLSAFRAKNMYMANYWEYRSFRADRLPSLTLGMTPLSYIHSFMNRYDSQQDIDIYRRQQILSSRGNLSVMQNFDLTGGTFFIYTELGYIQNFGKNEKSQFNSIPVSIGYKQELIGYMTFC